MMRCSYLFVFVMLFSLSNCKSKKDAMANDGGQPELIFGSSGGFAGKTEKFKLLPDGQIFEKSMSSDTYQPVGSFEKDIAQQFFDNYTTLGFDELVLDDPGNMTYFIIIKQGDRKKKLAWGGMNKSMPEQLDIYYRNFMKLKKRYMNPTK